MPVLVDNCMMYRRVDTFNNDPQIDLSYILLRANLTSITHTGATI